MIDGTQRLLVFNVCGNRYALDLQDVAEVLAPSMTFPVPWAPGFLKGAMNFHGNLVTLLDLAEFMNIGAMDREGNFLVLDKRIANLALWVDGVENILLADAVLEEDESDDPLVDKVLIMADGEIRMLAVEKLLESIEETLRR
jgi:purine-binding chemotaxis protein CheW